MAEKIQDTEDRFLESLMASPPIADDGFSTQIVGNLKRRLWIRRLTVPVAGIIGGVLAFKPLSGLVTIIASLSSMIPKEVVRSTADSLPQMSLIMLGAALLVTCLVGLRFLED
jgi:hypothetical protein